MAYAFLNEAKGNRGILGNTPVSESPLAGRDEVGVGASDCPGGHSLKLQGDVFHRFSDFDLAGGSTEFRFQLQAAF